VQYIRKLLTNFAKIWYNDASRPAGTHQPIKFSDLKIQDGRWKPF